MTTRPGWIVLAVVLSLCGCKKEQPPPAIRPALTTVATLQTNRVLGFAGTIEPRYRASLGFQVLGRVITREVNVGDIVAKGRQLASIDPTTLSFAVRVAQADLSNAQAQFVNAGATEARQRILVQQNTSTSAQYELAQQARESATAGVTRAQANLAKAQEQLGYAQLRAEFDGVVISVDAEVGQVVSPGQTVITIARPDVREAVVDVSEDVDGALQSSAPFDVTLQIDPTQTTTGRVREIGSQADLTTRTRRVRITLDNPPDAFRLGSIVTATLTTTIEPQIQIPASAILERDHRTMVWTVDPATGAAGLREVTVASRAGSTVWISGGLVPGAQVVIAGVNSLASGQIVKIAERDQR